MDIKKLVQSSRTGESDRPLRLQYGDIMRFLAISCVVLIHAVSPYSTYAGTEVRYYPLPIFFVGETFTRWCVPIFFMLSGALLLDPARQESARQFYQKRLRKIAIPVLFWSLFYIWDSHYSSFAIVKSVLEGRPGRGYHLWFVFAMLGLYVATPMIRSFFSRAPRSDQWQLAWGSLGVWTVALLCWILLGKAGWRVPPDSLFIIEWIPYVGYFLLGYLMRELTLTPKGIKAALLSFFVLATFSAFGLKLAYAHHQKLRGDGLFTGYVSPVTIVMAVCVFLLLATAFQTRLANNKLVQTLGEASFGVYLIHVEVLEKLRNSDWILGNSSNLLVLSLWLATLTLSYAASILLLRIPLAKRIVGG